MCTQPSLRHYLTYPCSSPMQNAYCQRRIPEWERVTIFCDKRPEGHIVKVSGLSRYFPDVSIVSERIRKHFGVSGHEREDSRGKVLVYHANIGFPLPLFFVESGLLKEGEICSKFFDIDIMLEYFEYKRRHPMPSDR